MDFSNIIWNKESSKEFIKYLESLANMDIIDRTKRILNTNLEVLALYAKQIQEIVKEIKKTNIIDYLDLMLFDYHELTIIYAHLIMELKDFELIKKYLNILSLNTDNWATCDTIPFIKIKKKYEKELFELAFSYAKKELPFQRRIGMIALFKYSEEKYLKQIFQLLNEFKEEEHYYVNMVNAWLISHIFVRNRTMTINFLNNHNLNKFTINKAISKCRDSFRVTKEDKEMLLKYKV